MSGAMQMLLVGSSAVASASVSISPPGLNAGPTGGTAYSANVTATPAGITTPTYSWTWLSGGTGFTLTNATTATVTVASVGRVAGTEQMGELKCTVSGTGGPASSSISVDVLWG